MDKSNTKSTFIGILLGMFVVMILWFFFIGRLSFYLALYLPLFVGVLAGVSVKRSNPFYVWLIVTAFYSSIMVLGIVLIAQNKQADTETLNMFYMLNIQKWLWYIPVSAVGAILGVKIRNFVLTRNSTGMDP